MCEWFARSAVLAIHPKLQKTLKSPHIVGFLLQLDIITARFFLRDLSLNIKAKLFYAKPEIHFNLIIIGHIDTLNHL
jgi:hypothetical protein